MTAPPPSPKLLERFHILTAKKERLWQRLQNCEELIPNLPHDLRIFQLRVKQLDDTRIEFTALLDDFAALENAHPDFSTNILDLDKAFDDIYYLILAAAAHYSDPMPVNACSTPNTPNDSNPASVQLPVIQLPKFDGTYEAFPAFKALYDNLIHDTDLPNIKKFSYLLGYLEKSPLSLIETVTFSPDNYIIAYNLLVQRYTNKRLIANHYLSAIFNLKPIKSDSHSALRDLADVIQTNVASLTSLNIPDMHDYILTEF